MHSVRHPPLPRNLSICMAHHQVCSTLLRCMCTTLISRQKHAWYDCANGCIKMWREHRCAKQILMQSDVWAQEDCCCGGVLSKHRNTKEKKERKKWNLYQTVYALIPESSCLMVPYLHGGHAAFWCFLMILWCISAASELSVQLECVLKVHLFPSEAPRVCRGKCALSRGSLEHNSSVWLHFLHTKTPVPLPYLPMIIFIFNGLSCDVDAPPGTLLHKNTLAPG